MIVFLIMIVKAIRLIYNDEVSSQVLNESFWQGNVFIGKRITENDGTKLVQVEL